MHVGLSLMVEADYRDAALPLFEAGVVDVLEWSCDMVWSRGGPPEWAAGLLAFFAEQGRLYGHGVTFSPLSASAAARLTVVVVFPLPLFCITTATVFNRLPSLS